jgi:hypothetical protein
MQIFHIVDRNNDNLIDPEEWKNFYNLFGSAFEKCDKNKMLMLSKDDFKKCLSSDASFKKTIEFNKKIKSVDDEKLFDRIFISLDLNKSDFINFYSYIKLRNYNKIYNILLDKEQEVNYQNFPIAVHLLSKNL